MPSLFPNETCFTFFIIKLISTLNPDHKNILTKLISNLRWYKIILSNFCYFVFFIYKYSVYFSKYTQCFYSMISLYPLNLIMKSVVDPCIFKDKWGKFFVLILYVDELQLINVLSL